MTTPAKQMAAQPTQDEVALFVMGEKARAWRDQPDLSEDHLKDEVMMRLARRVLAMKAQMSA